MNRWLDVSWYEMKIGVFEGVPSPTLSIREIQRDVIDAICGQYSDLI